MSVKAMGLVWDLECPQTINGVSFLSHHKYVLLAYADHADHAGKSIYPAVETIQKKTGYKSERSIQNITHDLKTMGILVDDGMGPRGTNRWKIPFSEKGDRIEPETPADIAPPQELPPASFDKSLGATPSGAIPLGAEIAPDFKEPEPNQLINNTNISDVWGATKAKLKHNMKRAEYETWIEPSEAIQVEDRTLTVVVSNSFARNWINKNILSDIQYFLGYYVKFITANELELMETR